MRQWLLFFGNNEISIAGHFSFGIIIDISMEWGTFLSWISSRNNEHSIIHITRWNSTPRLLRHFSTAVNQAKKGDQRKRKKISTFFCFDETAKTRKYSRSFRFCLFQDKWNETVTWENWLYPYPTEILKIPHLIWKKTGTYFRFYKREWNRQKRHRIFRFARKSEVKKAIFKEFCSF